MTPALQRVTTVYVATEDRIRLAGEVEHGAPLVIWLTRRLLERLLPVLLQRLEHPGPGSVHAEVMQSFAQQAAAADLAPQAPVQPSAGSTAWLAMTVDVAAGEGSVSLTMRGADGQQASLSLAAKPLRQWLGIVHDAYVQGGWPLDVWPLWVRQGAVPASGPPAVLH